MLKCFHLKVNQSLAYSHVKNHYGSNFNIINKFVDRFRGLFSNDVDSNAGDKRCVRILRVVVVDWWPERIILTFPPTGCRASWSSTPRSKHQKHHHLPLYVVDPIVDAGLVVHDENESAEGDEESVHYQHVLSTPHHNLLSLNTQCVFR